MDEASTGTSPRHALERNFHRGLEKPVLGALCVLVLGLALMAGAATLTSDPLTGLPLHPATDSRLHLGNEPTKLPASSVCGSKMRADFYAVFDSKQPDTVAWYAARLKGFRSTHAFAANRLQDTFYNDDGTLIVSVTGVSGKDSTETYSILYARLEPGLPEKVIVSLNRQRVVCP